MIKVLLTDDVGQSCIVEFDDCESMGEPDKPVFGVLSMQFPWQSIPNEIGYLSHRDEISPRDFIYKAIMFGFEAKVTN